MGKVAFGVWVARMGVGEHLVLDEPQIRKFFSRYMGKEGSLQVPALLPKSPALVLSQTPSFAYLFNRKRQKPAKPQAWTPAPAPAQLSPAWENGWLGSVQGPKGPPRTRFLDH